ncbi:MAG: hypothetical protein LUH05_07325 [Candidatus Gastranaerophilales bacterium]|nr:hypothetical protein [Candidatus Gastranaerophilales bacterium]
MQGNNLQNNNFEKNITNSFSMRKIPVVSNSCSENENIKDDNIDKIKIIELSNFIDKWEQEVLFSDNGFFSIKGKEIKNKSKDFINELEDFINTKISEISFSSPFFKNMALQIKKDKISSIEREMLSYEQQQLKEWETQVYEDAISSSISRAILYKSNPNIVSSSFKNGLSVIKVMSEKEEWNRKTYNQKVEAYKSQFFSSLINSFVQDKDIKAFIYFNKHKDMLQDENKEKLEEAVNQLKVNVIAYNWAKELFSYKLDKSKQEDEIKKVKDEELEKSIRSFLNNFSQSEKKEQEEKDKDKNQKNWEEIINIVNEDIDKALLYVDYSMPKDNIKHKKEYINQIKQNGYISTDKKQFISLLTEFFIDFEKFKQKDISDFQYCFSKEDYDLFLDFQKTEKDKFLQLFFDYKYIQKKFNEAEIKKTEEQYDFIKLLILSKEEYKSVNKKEADLDNRNKLIDLVTERFKQNKKEGEKNDRIIDSTGK